MENKTIKVGDIIGNTVQGFDWEVLEVCDPYYMVKNVVTGEEFKTFRDNMRLPKIYKENK